MSERYRSTFVAIVVFTAFWFVIILLCLPSDIPDDNLSSAKLISTTSKVGDGAKVSGNVSSGTLGDAGPNYVFGPPQAPHFMKYFQPNFRGLKEVEVLFYQFSSNSQEEDLLSIKPIDQKEHENVTKKLGSTESLTDQYVRTEGDRLFAFNMLVSNRIGAIRRIPDTRHLNCPMRATPQTSANDIPYMTSNGGINLSSSTKLKCSIIICHYNEAPSALIRTIKSVLLRSPLTLIHEILVVDDFSSAEYQADRMKPFISSDLVKFVRTERREGLIRARLFGAKMTKGDILVFLDSHVEANVGWLEPLVDVIEQNRSSIGCPMIDLINAETLIYTASPMVQGGLNWALNFKWDSVPSDKLMTYDDFVKPIESPTMAGGLFAIHRDYFYQLGAYDSSMELWGGENVELSLRAWLCGGRILILPCSRLGHIFRKRRPYGPEPDKPDSLLYNSKRAAQVWLGDYIEKFYEANPSARQLNSGDVSDRLALKKSLGCKDFDWFLSNVYPGLTTTRAPPSAESGKSKPKLFKFRPSPRRVDRSAETTTMTTMKLSDSTHLVNSLRLSEITRLRSGAGSAPLSGNLEAMSAQRYSLVSREFEPFLRRMKNSLAPKVVSRFQIQASNSNFCIESKDGLIGKRFARLVLNYCFQSDSNMSGNSLAQDPAHLAQSWTETELHEFRIGRDNQCLDLVKNLPSLRRCHNMGSFQKWTSGGERNSLIYNLGGGLCLGVEKVQIGEPIIITICDAGDEDNQVRGATNKRAPSKIGRSLAHYRRLNDRIVNALKVYQRWNIINLT